MTADCVKYVPYSKLPLSLVFLFNCNKFVSFFPLKENNHCLSFHVFSPQTARWKVTSKEALQRIGEYSEAAITIRGTYFPPGKEPKEGERKIYLAIESMFQGS